MFIWCAVLFLLGISAFMDTLFNMGEIFRKVNSVLFMLISLGLLIRTTTKMKESKVEHYKKQIFHLEQRIRTLEQGKEKLGKF
jgi:hypothetical protein